MLTLWLISFYSKKKNLKCIKILFIQEYPRDRRNLHHIRRRGGKKEQISIYGYWLLYKFKSQNLLPSIMIKEREKETNYREESDY